MAYSTTSFNFFLICCLFLISSSSAAQSTTRSATKGLILRVSKDPSTFQYTTEIKQRTPLVTVKLIVDLGGLYLWVNCEEGYTTSTYRPARCDSAQCKLAKSTDCMTMCYSHPAIATPACSNNTCTLWPENTYISITQMGTLGSDALSIPSAVGGAPVSISHFLFVCGSTLLLGKLASGVTGSAGLGRAQVSVPTQLSSAFNLEKKFGMCLSSTSSNGAIYFGGFDSSTAPLTYTPLLTNPASTAAFAAKGEASSEYFIGVKSIKINKKTVVINPKLLSIDATGHGGTKISTLDKYTVLETSIYKAVVNAFVKELNMPRVPSISPFGACFSTKNIGTAYTGPAVPTIDLVLQSKDVYWRIYGGNSMIRVNKDVLCLGFVDGGLNSRTSIVIGGHQLEENLLEIDNAASKLGFSPLLYRKQTCASFKFVAKA